MKKISALLLSFAIMFMLFPAVYADGTYTLNVTSDLSYAEGGEVLVKITLDNIGIRGGVTFVSFDLFYDASAVTPVVKNVYGSDNAEMLRFLSGPTGWEGVCSLNESRGCYELAYMTDSKEHAAVNDGDITVTVPFTVNTPTADSIRFYTSGSYCTTYDISVFNGTEGSHTLKKLPSQPTPAAPVLKAASSTSVELYAVSGAQYRCVGSDYDSYWCDAPLFTGLVPQETYSFYVRMKETGKAAPSQSSAALKVTMLFEGLTLVPGSAYSMDGTGRYLYTPSAHETAKDVAAQFSNSNVEVLDASGSAVSGTIGTGMTVVMRNKGGAVTDTVTIVVKGDLNGDGMIDSVDYMLLKRAVLGIVNIDGAVVEAATLSGSSFPEAIDYALLKRHVLGILDIYA